MSAEALMAGLVFLLVCGVGAVVIVVLWTVAEDACRVCRRRIHDAPMVDLRGSAHQRCHDAERRRAS